MNYRAVVFALLFVASQALAASCGSDSGSKKKEGPTRDDYNRVKSESRDAFDEMEGRDDGDGDARPAPKREARREAPPKREEEKPKAAETKSGPRPAWIDKPYAELDRRVYLVGVGSGDDRSAAGEHARADLAKQISVHIQDEMKIYEREATLNNDVLNEVSVEQRSKSTVDLALNGVEVRECWRSNEGRIYCQGVLERGKAYAEFSAKVADADSEIQTYIQQAEGAGADRIKRLKFLALALSKLQERQANAGLARAVSPDNEEIPLPKNVNVGRFKAELEGALADIKVFVSLDDGEDSDRVIYTGISESLNKAKMTVVSSEQGADLIVRGELKGKPVNKNSTSGFKFAEFTVNLQLVNPASGDTFGTITQAKKEGAMDLNDARNRALKRLGGEVVKEFTKKLRGFIAG